MPTEVPDANLSNPEIRKGIYFNIRPNDVVLPTKNNIKPSDLRFFSFLLTVATGAQWGTEGFITAYFSTDDDAFPSTTKWDLQCINSVLDFKEQARRAGVSVGYHRTVSGLTRELRTTFNISSSLSMKNFDCDSMEQVGRVYFFYPASIAPTVRLYAKCAFEGTESSSVPQTPTELPRYDTVYSSVSHQFLRKAFRELARPVFFNAHVDDASVSVEDGLFILYSLDASTALDLSRPAMELLTEADLDSYRPPLNGIVFPRRDPISNLLTSSLSTWCRQKIILPRNGNEPAQYWWAHVQPENFTVISERDVQLVDCYERLPTITPRNRTAAEVLTSCTSGGAALSVSANDRPSDPVLDSPELRDILELMARTFAPLNTFLTRHAANNDQSGSSDHSCSDDDYAEERQARHDEIYRTD
jgi:hypothetical protein